MENGARTLVVPFIVAPDCAGRSAFGLYAFLRHAVATGGGRKSPVGWVE